MTDELKIDRPIRGDIERSYRSHVPQVGPEEFLAQVDSLLELPGVSGLVWEQYAPSFNDGDPCVFSIHEVRVLIDGLDPEEDYEDTDYGSGFSTYELWNYGEGETWQDQRDNRTFIELPGDADGEAIYAALEAVNTDAWENVAQANFGESAQVTATKDGFSVDYYEHD